MKEFYDKLALQRNDYILEFEAIGWHSLLDANRIKNDKTFVESEVLIHKAKEIVAKYRKRTYYLLEGVKDNIRSLNVSKSLKKACSLVLIVV